MRAMIKGEMGSVWDRLGKVEKIHHPLAPPFSEDEIPLPYTKELLSSVVIGDTKAPKIALYEGLTDPYDHLDNFRYAMEGRGANEATKCRLFPTTLKGAALNWFKRLSPESVGSFSELRRAFLDRYMIISSRLYTANDLSAVRQKTNESLRDYITRFNNEYARCEGCDEATAHNALMGGLQGGDFFFHLTRNPPETYKDLLREATCYSRAEQLNSARTGTIRDQGREVGRSRTPEPRKGNPQKKDQNRLSGRRDRAPERYYTPLKTNKEAILAIAGKELPAPRQGRHEYLGKRDEARKTRYRTQAPRGGTTSTRAQEVNIHDRGRPLAWRR
ncbi:unnamed protein product [Prunus brigantina]